MPEFSNGYGIKFCGQHTWNDFGLRVIDKEVTFPEKKIVTVTPPYSNQVIDLSALYGHQVFQERTFKLTFLLTAWETHTKEQLYRVWTRLINWLQGTPGRRPLVDDIMSGYYYLGEVVNAPSFDEFKLHGKLTVEWTCYPFRIHDALEGDDIWDTFDFDLDVAQDTKFAVAGIKAVTLINAGIEAVRPTVVTDNTLTVTIGDDTWELSKGANDAATMATPLVLPVGISQVTVTGTGSIDFQWHKEVI